VSLCFGWDDDAAASYFGRRTLVNGEFFHRFCAVAGRGRTGYHPLPREEAA
jgi:hypothetical protein